jgi:hypothetical protein
MSARESFDPFIRRLLAIVAVAHVALAIFVPDLARKFQLGDRAWDRTAKIDALLQTPDLDAAIAMLFYNGAPGDYIFFLPAYAAFGAAGVIAQNIVLLLIGLWFLYRIGRAWFTPAAARIATVTYALLLATLFHPQVFASEAICNPLLIVAVWYAGRLLTSNSPERRDAILFGLVSAVLVFTRHIYLLFPIMVAGLLLARAGWTRRALAAICVILALSFSLAGGWRAANWATEGRYEVAESFHGLDSNLFLRAERMAKTGGFALSQEALQRRAVSVGAFAMMSLEHPAPLLRTVFSDAVNLTGNTGVSMVYGRYLGLFDLGEKGDADMFKWRDIRDREGTLAMLVYMGRTAPLALIFNAGFALLWLGLILVALVGAWRFLFDGTRDFVLRLLFAGVPLYVFAFTFASGSVRWDHRSPMEFVICLFFAAGIPVLASLAGRAERRFPISETG